MPGDTGNAWRRSFLNKFFNVGNKSVAIRALSIQPWAPASIERASSWLASCSRAALEGVGYVSGSGRFLEDTPFSSVRIEFINLITN
jgi:hypothetical protein